MSYENPRRHSRMVSVEGIGSQIMGNISGLPTGTITNAYVKYLPAVGGGWIQATSIPVGAQCQFYCSINANSGGGTSWSTVVTVVDLYDGVLKQYHIASLGMLGLGGNVNDVYSDGVMGGLPGSPWLMPNHDLQLSFRLFASFDATPNTALLNSGDPSLYY